MIDRDSWPIEERPCVPGQVPEIYTYNTRAPGCCPNCVEGAGWGLGTHCATHCSLGVEHTGDDPCRRFETPDLITPKMR